MKVLCLGHATWDIVIPVDEYPIENTKNRVNNLIECGGGPASNAAYLLGKWGIDTYFCGVVGNDENGKKIKKEFINDNVNTDYLQLSDNHTTTTSYVIVNEKTGSRTALAHHPSNLKMNDQVIDNDFRFLHIDGQEYEMSLKMLENKNIISVIDAGRVTDEVIDLCKKVNYVVCSKDFALKYTNEKDLEKIFQKLKKDFKGEIIITLEEKGCAYYHDKLKIIPTIKVKPVDSTGAGDIFHGAFCYGIANGYPLEKAIKYGNIAAGLSCQTMGARLSVPKLDDVVKIYEKIN